MKVHHLNCGTLNPRLVDVQSLVYCLLVETGDGLVLVDTGFGTEDYSNPSWKMNFFLNWMGVPRDRQETALSQVRRLGFKPEHVRHIIMTHMHVDHAGGLADFPWAEVHLSGVEYRSIQRPRGLMEFAYFKEHWDHRPAWVLHEEPLVDWYGFEALPVLETEEVNILLLPLPGHTRGHCGVAVGKPGDWLLHCGDAASPYHPGSDLHQRGRAAHKMKILPDGIASRILGGHVPRLHSLLDQHQGEIRAISSHDMFSFQEFNQSNPINP